MLDYVMGPLLRFKLYFNSMFLLYVHYSNVVGIKVGTITTQNYLLNTHYYSLNTTYSLSSTYSSLLVTYAVYSDVLKLWPN